MLQPCYVEVTMLSLKQLAANRANAKKSTGPKTEEGKQRSSLNALRHGLTGQVSLMTDDDRAAHDAFSKSIIDDLKPVGAMELQLAQRIATDSWRINRLAAFEDNIYCMWHETNLPSHSNHPQIDTACSQTQTFLQKSDELNRLSLYEQRLNRSIQKNMAMLKQLQKERKAEQQAQPTEKNQPAKQMGSIFQMPETAPQPPQNDVSGHPEIPEPSTKAA
jgi:hypothetical protein